MKVVVIGASWGGLYALMEVLGALPAAFPAPIVIVHQQDARGHAANLVAISSSGKISDAPASTPACGIPDCIADAGS